MRQKLDTHILMLILSDFIQMSSCNNKLCEIIYEHNYDFVSLIVLREVAQVYHNLIHRLSVYRYAV